MSDEAVTGPDGGQVSVVALDSDAKASNVHDAARALIDARKKRDDAASPAAANDAARAATAESDTKSAEKADAAPPQEATGETKEADPPDEAPIELPRSWAKDKAELWATLPRETQEYLRTHDSEASTAVRKAQNEAAEKLKGLTAKEQQIEQARQQYEAGLVTMQQALQANLAGEFADIKTMADVSKMAAEDWPRYIRWDAAQKQLAAVAEEKRQADARQHQEAQQKLVSFANEQDRLFIEHAPEMADKTKQAAESDAAIKVLKDIGFTDEEMAASWNGAEKFSLRDHRMQLLIRDAYRYRAAAVKAKAPDPKPVPTVQRPGVSRPSGAANADQVQALTSKLEKTGSIKDAAALLRARRAG